MGLVEVSYSSAEAYAKAFAVVLFVDMVLQFNRNFQIVDGQVIGFDVDAGSIDTFHVLQYGRFSF